MSGIVGVYNLDGSPLNSIALQKAVDRLAHRGPDVGNVWKTNTVGFGHRMLHTTAESIRETLPLSLRDGDLVITADARLDNREDLIYQLNLQNYSSQPLTDSYLILKAYEKWDDRCLDYLLGDFAFAIWDARRQALFCGRDPMGVKPFYYYRSATRFIFASEVKGVLCWPEVPTELDEMRIAQHLVGVLEEKIRTFYKHVVRLPAAHGLLVVPEGQRLWSYWSPEAQKELRFRSDKAYAEAYQELFIETVECRLRSIFPVGSMLSGGLDSSSIACVARNALSHHHHPKFPTFSAIFPSLADDYPEIDERPYIQAVVDTGGFDPHYVHADRFSPLESRDLAHWHLDAPSIAPNLYMDWIIFRAAHEQGVRVLFSGQDGDSTIGYGHEYLTVLARQGRWLKMHQEAKHLARIFHQSAVSPSWLMWNYGFKYLIPPAFWSLRSHLQKMLGKTPPRQVSKLIHPSFAQKLGLEDYLQEIAAHKKRFRSIQTEHAEHLTNGAMEYTLETLDHLAAAFSLEMRYPFCDRRLIEFCIAAPASQRLQKGWTRSIQRRGMEGILPSKVQWRPDKGNLSANFKQKMLTEQAVLDKAIFDQGYLLENYVDLSRLQSAYQNYGPQLFTNDSDALKVFSILTLSRWLADSQNHSVLTH